MSSQIVTSADVLIRVRDNAWPCSLAMMRSEHNQVSFPVNPTVQTCRNYGYEVVQPTPAPNGDVVTETNPELRDGVWYQAWTVSPFSQEQIEQMVKSRRQTILNAIRRRYTQDIEQGVPHDFNGVTNHIQVRDRDRINLAGLRIEADEAIQNGITEAIWKFRTFENVNHELTSTEMVAVTKAALLGFVAIKNSEWYWVDLANSTESLDELAYIAEEMFEKGYALEPIQW